MKKKLTKKFWIILICIFCVFITLVAVGYHAFSNRTKKVVEKEEKGGKVTLNYSTNVNGLSIVGATKIADDVAMKDMTAGKYFDFSIDVDISKANSVEYEIFITKDVKNSNISDDDIRIYLEKEKSGTYSQILKPTKYMPLKKESQLGSKKGSMILNSNKTSKSVTENYRLRLWLSDTSLLETGNYSVNVFVVGKAS